MLSKKAVVNRTAGVSRRSQVEVSGLSEDVTWRSKLESGSNKQEFGWLCVCHVSVERCWVKIKDKDFGRKVN